MQGFAEVVDLRSIRPLDTATIVNSVKKTNRLVSVEEGWPFAGIGSEMAALMMDLAIMLFYLVYTFFFNIAYDRVYPLPETRAAA